MPCKQPSLHAYKHARGITISVRGALPARAGVLLLLQEPAVRPDNLLLQRPLLLLGPDHLQRHASGLPCSCLHAWLQNFMSGGCPTSLQPCVHACMATVYVTVAASCGEQTSTCPCTTSSSPCCPRSSSACSTRTSAATAAACTPVHASPPVLDSSCYPCAHPPQKLHQRLVISSYTSLKAAGADYTSFHACILGQGGCSQAFWKLTPPCPQPRSLWDAPLQGCTRRGPATCTSAGARWRAGWPTRPSRRCSCSPWSCWPRRPSMLIARLAPPSRTGRCACAAPLPVIHPLAPCVVRQTLLASRPCCPSRQQHPVRETAES